MFKILLFSKRDANSIHQLNNTIYDLSKGDYKLKVFSYYNQNSISDFILDSAFFFNLRGSDNNSKFTSTYQAALKYIETYNPDLILSDLDFLPFYIARDLDIKLWVVSSDLLFYATEFKTKLLLEKKYKVYYKNNRTFLINIELFEYADKLLIYSQTPDIIDDNIESGYSFVYPEKKDKLILNGFNIANTKADFDLLKKLRNKHDNINYFCSDNIDNLKLKNINIFNIYEGNNYINYNLSLSNGCLINSFIETNSPINLFVDFYDKNSIFYAKYLEYNNMANICNDNFLISEKQCNIIKKNHLTLNDIIKEWRNDGI